MHAIAPGKRTALHAGHCVAVAGAAAAALLAVVVAGAAVGAAAGGRVGGAGVGARGAAGLLVAAGLALPTATASRAGAAAPTVNGFWQLGHRNCLPAESSAIRIAVEQFGHLITIGIAFSVS